jgi:hypothetical protein
MRPLGLGLLALTAAASAAWADEATALSHSLKHWLTLVDRAQYGDSWAEAGGLFRGQITEHDWAGRIAAVRAPLGPVVTRMVAAQNYTRTLPGLPDGDYDVVRFTTAFQHKPEAVETVILQKEDKGWKVDGYFIK